MVSVDFLSSLRMSLEQNDNWGKVRNVSNFVFLCHLSILSILLSLLTSNGKQSMFKRFLFLCCLKTMMLTSEEIYTLQTYFKKLKDTSTSDEKFVFLFQTKTNETTYLLYNNVYCLLFEESILFIAR